MEPLETPSLRLDPLAPDHYDWLYGLYADPEVMRFISPGGRTPEETKKRLDTTMEQAARLGYGAWVARERASGATVGSAMIMVRKPGWTDELGFAFARAAWGRGYGTEVTRAMIDYAFGKLGLPALQAFTIPENEASNRVLLKAGMRDEGLAEGPYGTPDRRFVLTREEWAAARAAARRA